MDDTGPEFDWNRARALLATAEHGSLSAAARALGTTQPTVGRQISALEDELGVILFERVGRGLVLTPSGERIVAEVRAMGEAALRISLAATGVSDAIEGRVKLTASDLFCATLMPPMVRALNARAPSLDIEVVSSNNLSDLLRREADIAIRHAEPQEGKLIARRLEDRLARLYVTRGRLPEFSDTRSPEDLRAHPFLGFTERPADSIVVLNVNRSIGLAPENLRVTSDSGIVMRELVAEGLGVGILPEDIGDADPRLARVPVDLEPATCQTWLVTHRELHRSARIRLAFDVIHEQLDRIGRT